MALELVLPPSLGSAKAEARAELIGQGLTRALGEEVRSSVAADYAELEAGVLSSRVDLVWCPSAVCAKLASARAVFTVVREGRATYRSALLAKRTAQRKISRLEGLRAAWVDPLSAGGYLLVDALLRARGLDPARVFGAQTFCGTHRSVLVAVLDDAADVGAVSIHGMLDEEIAAMLRWYVGPSGDRLEAIAVTDPCPNDAFVITDRVPLERVRRLSAAIADLGAKAGSTLLVALEADGLTAGSLEPYRAAFAPRRSVRPPAAG